METTGKTSSTITAEEKKAKIEQYKKEAEKKLNTSLISSIEEEEKEKERKKETDAYMKSLNEESEEDILSSDDENEERETIQEKIERLKKEEKDLFEKLEGLNKELKEEQKKPRYNRDLETIQKKIAANRKSIITKKLTIEALENLQKTNDFSLKSIFDNIFPLITHILNEEKTNLSRLMTIKSVRNFIYNLISGFKLPDVYIKREEIEKYLDKNREDKKVKNLKKLTNFKYRDEYMEYLLDRTLEKLEEEKDKIKIKSRDEVHKLIKSLEPICLETNEITEEEIVACLNNSHQNEKVIRLKKLTNYENLPIAKFFTAIRRDLPTILEKNPKKLRTSSPRKPDKSPRGEEEDCLPKPINMGFPRTTTLPNGI